MKIIKNKQYLVNLSFCMNCIGFNSVESTLIDLFSIYFSVAKNNKK